MKGATLEVFPGLGNRNDPAQVARLTGVGGWLLWKIITLWLSAVVFVLVAIGPGARISRGVAILCFCYAIFSGITAYMLQAKKPGAVIVATIFSLFTGSIVWMIYFGVSRRVMYTYAKQTDLEPVKQPLPQLQTVHLVAGVSPGQPGVIARLP